MSRRRKPNIAGREARNRILVYLEKAIRMNGIPPSFREIADGAKIGSTSGVSHHLSILEREGYIERNERMARSIRLLKDVNGKPFPG